MRMRTQRAALLAAVLLVFGSAAARAQSEAGWKVGSAMSTLIYTPVKAAYAASGLVFGGVSWALSGGNEEVARAVIGPAVQGDYLVTPEHLRRERSLIFIGGRSFTSVEPESSYTDAPYADSYGSDSDGELRAPSGKDPEYRERDSDHRY